MRALGAASTFNVKRGTRGRETEKRILDDSFTPNVKWLMSHTSDITGRNERREKKVRGPNEQRYHTSWLLPERQTTPPPLIRIFFPRGKVNREKRVVAIAFQNKQSTYFLLTQPTILKISTSRGLLLE